MGENGIKGQEQVPDGDEIEITDDTEFLSGRETWEAEAEAPETEDEETTGEETSAAMVTEEAPEAEVPGAEEEEAPEAEVPGEEEAEAPEAEVPGEEEPLSLEEDRESASGDRKKPSTLNWRKVLPAAVLAAAAACGIGMFCYVRESEQFRKVFFPNTAVNGVDVSYRTVEQVKELLASDVENYVLNIRGRDGLSDAITNDEIGLHMVFDESLEQYLAAQDPMDWWKHRKTATEYQVRTGRSVNEQMLDERIGRLVFFDESKTRKPRDAYLSDYRSGEGYVVVPEDPGNRADREAVGAAVSEAVENLETELDLEEQDAYVKPAVTSDDAELNARAAKRNRYVNTVITYQFGDREEVLDGDIIVNWMSEGDDGEVSIDPGQIEAYVKELAEKYDTVGKPKTLRTTSGAVAAFTVGNYGWKIDQKEEAKQLAELVAAGESLTREPVYSQTADSHGEHDYGDTYVEVNLSAQHLYFYKNGSLVIESDLVSGNHARGHDTPSGAYVIAYKQRDRILRGERRADGSYGYASHVNYWMPFNGGIGLHDATWRGAFGGKIYLTNGSHGCVNLPKAAAETIYENIDVGTAVLCYREEEIVSGETAESGTNPSAEPANAPEPTALEPEGPADTEEPAPPEDTEETVPPADTEEPVPLTDTEESALPADTDENRTGPAAPLGEEAGDSEEERNSEAAVPGPGDREPAGPGGGSEVGPDGGSGAASEDGDAAVPGSESGASPGGGNGAGPGGSGIAEEAPSGAGPGAAPPVPDSPGEN